MRRPWLAAMITSVAAAAILLLCFGVGPGPSEHGHDTASVELAAAAAPGRSGPTPPTSAAPAPTAPATSGAATSPAAAGDHQGHPRDAVTTQVTPPAAVPTRRASDAPTRLALSSSALPTVASSPSPVVTGDPAAPAANRRQVSLADAAGGLSGTVGPAAAAAPPSAGRWVVPDAAGVNDGTRKQAAGLALRPAERVDPTQILPEHGLANGCAVGYGKGVACLPQTPPSHAGHGSDEDMSVYWTCAEARPLLPEGIVVDAPGEDRLGLDSNGDGVACGPGDR